MKENKIQIQKINHYTSDKGSEYIEPEIVNEYENDNAYSHSRFYYFKNTWFSRYFSLIFIVAVFISLIFILAGLVLSSTLIGAIFGIPLLIVGVVGLYIVIKFFRFFGKFLI